MSLDAAVEQNPNLGELFQPLDHYPPSNPEPISVCRCRTIMITTAFTNEFRMTLVYGLAFMVALVAAYLIWYRKRG